MTIYRDDRDREEFLELVAKMTAVRCVDCHAFCLMDNHYHMVVTTKLANLSQAIQQVNSRYAEWWNHRHSRPGHVFQGRFGAQVIQADGYMLTACRYAVLNPVRAGMVPSPEQYRWSSYRATAGLEAAPPFLRPEMLWQLLGGDDTVGAVRYRHFVGADGPALPRKPILGDEAFVSRFADCRRAANLEVPMRERRTAKPIECFFIGAVTAAGRAAGASAARRAGYSCIEIAVFLEVHPATVRRMVKRLAGTGVTVAETGEFRCDPT
jgi:putative transposase